MCVSLKKILTDHQNKNGPGLHCEDPNPSLSRDGKLAGRPVGHA